MIRFLCYYGAKENRISCITYLVDRAMIVEKNEEGKALLLNKAQSNMYINTHQGSIS